MTRAWLLSGCVCLVVGVAAVSAGWALEPRQAMFSTLTASVWGATTALGALFWLMLGVAARSSWFVILRRMCEGLVASLPLFALLFIPVWLSLDEVYSWVPGGMEMPHHVSDAVEKKRAFLNVPFYFGREAFYWLFFVALGGTLLVWSRSLDRGDSERLIKRMRGLSAIGFFALTLVGTFAVVDWIMSLDPAWYSTMFGGYILIGGFVSAGGWLAWTAWLSQRAGKLEPYNAEHRQALGTVIFAGVCGWAWFAFAQFYLIWIANLPEEIRWYLDRVHGPWLWIGLGIPVVRWALPFFLLLMVAVKRNPLSLMAVGIWSSLGHYAHMYWLIMPRLHEHDVNIHWLDGAAWLAALGALITAHGLWTRSVPTIPEADPRYPAALEYEGT